MNNKSLDKLPSTIYLAGTSTPIRRTRAKGPDDHDDYGIRSLPDLSVTVNPNNDIVIDMPDAPPPWLGTVAYLQNCVDAEKGHWAAKYENDPSFRVKINNYVNFRAEVFKRKEAGAPPVDLDSAFKKLGSMLADAFGMIDPATGDWTPAVIEACKNAGSWYADASVKAFCVAQTPSMLRSALNLLGQAAVGLGAPPLFATVVHNVTGFASSLAQIPVSIYAAEKNAEWQSLGVQLMKMENPEFVPNVQSSKIVMEDGTLGELRSLNHVQEDLNDLDWVSDLLESGTEAELEYASRLYSGKMDGAEAKLLKHLSNASERLGALQQQGHGLNATERELKKPERPLLERAELLSKISRGRAALPGPAKHEVKRHLEQIKHWELLVKDLDAGRIALEQQRAAKNDDPGTNRSGSEIESSMSEYSDEATPLVTATMEAPRPVIKSEALRKAHSDRAFEQIKILQYRAMNVLTNQSWSRNVRSYFNLTTVAGQFVLPIAEHIAGKEFGPASDAWSLAMSLAQTIVYAWTHPEQSGKDYLNKIATQWNIVAMTGTGNFFDKTGKFLPSKLDAAVTGPLLTRLSTLASILVFDRSVYTENTLGWIVDPRTLDDDQAVRAELNLPEKDKDGKIVKDENGVVVLRRKSVACTYLSLATEFQKLPGRAHRKRFITELMEQLNVSKQVGGCMLRNLDCYEENEANISLAIDGDVSSLLVRAGEAVGDGSPEPETIELFEWIVPNEDEKLLKLQLTGRKPEAEQLDKPSDSEDSPRSIASNLAAQFQSLPTRDERQSFVDELIHEHRIPPEVEAAMKQSLATYEKKRGALPAGIASMLRSSLMTASRHIEGDREQDRKLFELMSEVEKRSEVGALQAAQKLGQQYAWIFAGTGSFLLIRSIFTFAAQAITLQGDLGGASVAERLATRLLATRSIGSVLGALSSLFSLGLNYAYHEYIAVKNLQRQAAGANLSIVNAPAPSLWTALSQEFKAGEFWPEFLEFLRNPQARVEEVSNYNTLAGRQIPEGDRPPKMKFIRQTKLTEATWEQMFSADLSSEPWKTWKGYFDEEHGSLEGKTTDELAAAIRMDLEKLKHYLDGDDDDSDGVRTSQDQATGADKKEISDDDSDIRIDDDKPPTLTKELPPSRPLSAPTTPRMPPLPATPINPVASHSPPWTRRVVSRGKSNQLTKQVSKRVARKKAFSVQGNHGESAIDPSPPVSDPSDIRRYDIPEVASENAAVDSGRPNSPPIEDARMPSLEPRGPSPMTHSLNWEQFERDESLFAARTANYVYLARSRSGENAIRMYGLPNDAQGIIHIATDKSPTLAVGNMLQMRLSGNTAWGTLASTTDFATFFNEHLSKVTPAKDRPLRIADKRLPDLALFSQQMALQHPDQGWAPLTGAGGTYVPHRDIPLQYSGVPPILTRGRPFAVQYTARDWEGLPMTNAVMMAWDQTDSYVVVDPKSKAHLRLNVDDPNQALQAFFGKIAEQDQAVESFNLLHHIPGSINVELGERIRAVISRGVDASGIVAVLRSEDKPWRFVKEWIETACEYLEAEKTFYLTDLNIVNYQSAALEGVQEIDGLLRILEAAYAQAAHYHGQEHERQFVQ